jgi:hypothetical protein
MFKANVLVRNLESSDERLGFGEFAIERVGLRYEELRDVFSSVDVNRDDWIFEKLYTVPPAGPPGSPVGGIPNDLEDILLLFRLYKPVTFRLSNRPSPHQGATRSFNSHIGQ